MCDAIRLIGGLVAGFAVTMPIAWWLTRQVVRWRRRRAIGRELDALRTHRRHPDDPW